MRCITFPQRPRSSHQVTITRATQTHHETEALKRVRFLPFEATDISKLELLTLRFRADTQCGNRN